MEGDIAMLASNDYINKRTVVHVREDESLIDVEAKLVKSGYRCIPVLDKTGKNYIGNVYKVDLLKYEREHSLDGKLADIIMDQDNGFIYEDDPFFKVFHYIKQLPYLAIINEDKEFLGILTNGNVIQVLEDAWGVHDGSYSLTIGTIEYSGALQNILEVINKYCNVQSVISLKNSLDYVRRVSIVLPTDVKQETVDKMIKSLEEKNFTVVHVEKLNYT